MTVVFPYPCSLGVQLVRLGVQPVRREKKQGQNAMIGCCMTNEGRKNQTMLGWRKRPFWSADGASVLNHRFFWVIVEMGGAGVKRWKDLTRETGKFEELCADNY